MKRSEPTQHAVGRALRRTYGPVPVDPVEVDGVRLKLPVSAQKRNAAAAVGYGGTRRALDL